MGESVEKRVIEDPLPAKPGPASVRFGFAGTISSAVRYESWRVEVGVTLPCEPDDYSLDEALSKAEQTVFDTFDHHAQRLTGDVYRKGKRK